ncbi:MAG TPA: hypothetical protein VGK19_12545 [Capsulimonadaceae bacterium]
MDFTERYTTQAGKEYTIKLSYNEKIGERDGSELFVRSLEVLDPSKKQVPVPVNAVMFSTYQQFTSFGAYSSINYLGVREAAIEGLRTKILTRIEDQLEGLG